MNIFLRTACLGHWVRDTLFGDKTPYHNYFNQQKVRADLLIDILNGKTHKPPMNSILDKHLSRKDMRGVYSQTESLLWISSGVKPDLFIIDSYSELVDKRFISNEGWSFCGLYGDFDTSFISNMHDDGLLEDVYTAYDNMFSFITTKWNVPIIYIHFPTTFDVREKYIKQGLKIDQAMNEICKKYNIQNIKADPDQIEQKDSDYYHMSDKTVRNLASKIRL
jgi:hypothetical protein